MGPACPFRSKQINENSNNFELGSCISNRVFRTFPYLHEQVTWTFRYWYWIWNQMFPISPPPRVKILYYFFIRGVIWFLSCPLITWFQLDGKQTQSLSYLRNSFRDFSMAMRDKLNFSRNLQKLREWKKETRVWEKSCSPRVKRSNFCAYFH